MKLINKIKICICILIISCIMPIYNFANEINLITETTEQFENWNKLSEEEKNKNQLPEISSIQIPNKIYNLENLNCFNIKDTFAKIKNSLGSSKAKLEKFNLIDEIEIEIKNQGITNQCWAFSMLSSMETNLALTKGIKKEFSERHMAYATTRKFADGINEKGYYREENKLEGIPSMGLSYLTNGQGAVLEEKMPFENNEDLIYLSQIDIEKDTYVTDYETLPTIYKNYDSDGNLKYSNGNGIEYNQADVENIRNKIKEHIVKYGAISATTAAGKYEYYNNQENIGDSYAYYCNDENVIRDHAITIVGWDDNYSKENFNPEIKPKSDGAYIILNSVGEQFFDNGFLYISYEDILIETSLYGISNTSEEEYYKLYQHDFFGGIASLGTAGNSTGYYANVYDRNSNESEILNRIGVSLCDYAKINIYVNPNGDEISEEKLIKVGSTNVLTPGYHTIDISDIELTSEKFAVIVEQISENNKFMFAIETYIKGTQYEVVTAEPGKSKISFDGKLWYNLSDMGVISGIDTAKSDICIKAFTIKKEENSKPEDPDEPGTPNEPEIPTEKNVISSSVYTIDNKYIKNVNYNTTMKEFLNNIQTKKDVKIVDVDEEILENDILKTGMILKSEDREYKIVVIGDINGDGKISLIDISKLVLHYGEQKGFKLENEYKEASDINKDNKISLIDISKLIILFNNVP